MLIQNADIKGFFSFMSELNTKNTFISLMVVVKKNKVLHEVVKHKISFLLLSEHCHIR